MPQISAEPVLRK